MTTKAQLRLEIEAKRRSLDAEWVRHASSKVVERLQELEAFHTAKTVALYKAIAGEVDLDPLFSVCWMLGKHTCIPVFNAEQKRYEMAEIASDTRFITGNYGIREPKSPSPVRMDEIDLIVVPGVAFDSKGNRLGRGGGYYDRLLAGFRGHSAAVAFDFQVVPSIPLDEHDIPVECIVTETKNVKVCSEH